MTSAPWRDDFLAGIGFAPDDFQIRAFDALDADRSVLVAAPTGSGKTLVAEYAVESALRAGRRIFYTAPIKALSNQKYRDFCDRYGVTEVGLLTGDNSINPSAAIIVMTTEVLRNMIYAGSEDIDDLHAVVLDEVHYIQDTYRGQVWEEIIVHLPMEVLLVCLSATVSNSDEIADWMTTVRGATEVVVSTHRPVPLHCEYAAFDRDTGILRVEPVLIDGVANPMLRRLESASIKSGAKRPQRRSRIGPPDRLDVIDHLKAEDLLPAIFFIFSRAQCDAASQAIANAGFAFNDEAQRERVNELIDEATQEIDKDDLDVLGIEALREAMIRGVAPHHAGMIAPLKECVERAFLEGLVQVVCATETLAVGINMPARAVVIEKVTKFRGEHHEVLSAADFTQLTGRAGRRGLDTKGVSVICANPFVRFDTVAGLVANKSFNLRSAFRPSCNMAANLMATHSQREAQHLLNLSLAQFQSDKEVVLLERRRERLQKQLRETGVETMTSDPSSVRRFALGEVLNVDSPSYSGVVAVISIADRAGGTRIAVVDVETDRLTFDALELSSYSKSIAWIEIPQPYVPQRRDFVVEVARRLDRVAPQDGSPHRRSNKRTGDNAESKRLRKEIEQLSNRQNAVTGAVARHFADVVHLMSNHGYAAGWSLTQKGVQLRNIFHELDLLIVEAMSIGVFDNLPPDQLAVVVSGFVYEPRGRDDDGDDWLPSNEVRKRCERILRMHRRLDGELESLGLQGLRQPDFGMARCVSLWSDGMSLREVLDDDIFTAGDFVRSVRNLVDLLNQIAEVANEVDTRASARSAVKLLDRGVVRIAAGVA